MSKEELWQAVLAQIQFNISSASFATWFKNTEILSIKEGEVIVSVPNNFSKEWLEQKYNKLIFKILHNLDERIKEVKYIVAQSNLKAKKIPIFLPEDNQLEFPEFNIDKETNLNPRYTFENFVVGPFNELSQAAATSVCKNPGMLYNPLFIYGGVGLGKTHLLQAIGNEIVRNFSSTLKVKYLPSEKFISGVINSIKNRKIEDFKIEYKNIDVLLIDDIQFLANKEKTQEEFFHIFNALYQKNKQIVLTSDRPPKALPTIEERLRSRFEGGMIADISFPDLETRIAILKMKSQERNIELSDEVYEYLANNIKKNIRELEGALNRLAAYQKINKQTPDLNITKILLKNLISSPYKYPNYKKIIQEVADFYGSTEKELLTLSRKKEIVKPRQIAMYLLREELKSSYPFIGRIFKGKDHTTVIYAYEKIKKEIKKNETLEEEINLIKQRIYSG
jgi:chromosomal replication initiator protein